MLKKMNILILIFCFVFLFSGCKKTEPSDSEGTTDAEKVKKETKEALSTTGEYLSEKSKEIMDQANKTYQQLESNTQKLITDMKESGKESWKDISSDLDGKLNTAEKKLSELKDASKESFQDTQDAFDAAIEELKDAYQKAKAEYEK